MSAGQRGTAHETPGPNEEQEQDPAQQVINLTLNGPPESALQSPVEAVQFPPAPRYVVVQVDATDNAGDAPATDPREDEHTPGTAPKYFIRDDERRVRQYVEQCCKVWCGYTEVPEPHRRMEGFRAVVDELHNRGIHPSEDNELKV